MNGSDNNNSSNKTQPSNPTFGRGWGAPAFGGQVSCTAAELKQREALLALQVSQKQSHPTAESETKVRPIYVAFLGLASKLSI